MRNADGTLNGNSNDNVSATTSGKIVFLPTSSVDENLTTYDLMPIILNRPPIITINISERSAPQIKSSATANASGEHLYRFPDGTVKVYIGSTFTLNIGAVQPDIYNVENGIPTIKAPDQELFFVWRQDSAIIRTRERPSLQSRTIVSGSSIRFERIQPNSAGTYTCEISNDIGAVQSEAITIEVLNPDLDAYFYRNLVINGNATTGVEGWTANNGDFVQKELYRKDGVELKTPNRVDLFGYNIDTMHPRPYQIETGLIKNVKYNEDFLKKGGGGYFTRDVYKFERAGGNYYVQAYQEIDVTEIQDIIRGSIYGIDGVRVVFGCYIGNAVSQWTPTIPVVGVDQKTNPENYYLGAPRISVQNFLMAGPGQTTDQVYVTLEEYDNESRLASTVVNPDGVTTTTLPTSVILRDPWDKRKTKYQGEKYYTKDVYGLGITSKGDWIDNTLFVADELYPNLNNRPTHGQYLEFNRVVLERLNPKTTKIRIAINFITTDWRMYEHWDYELLGSDRIFEHVGWEAPHKKNTFIKEADGWIRSILDVSSKYKDRPPIEKYTLAPSPRLAVTGLSLALIPIERLNKKATDYYTTTALSLNNKPVTQTPSALSTDFIFDPEGKLNQELFVTFKHNSPASYSLSNGLIEKSHRTSVSLTSRRKGDTSSPKRISNATSSLFPFAKGKLTYVYAENSLEFNKNVSETENTLRISNIRKNFVREDPFPIADPLGYKHILNTAPAWTAFGSFSPTKDVGRKVEWKNVAKYMLYYIATSDGSTKFNSYLLVIEETAVTIYRDASLASGTGEAEFKVTDYTIDTNGTLDFSLPIELLTASIEDGGLGIPAKQDHMLNLNSLEALQAMKQSEGEALAIGAGGVATDPMVFSSNRQYNIDELWKSYFQLTTDREWMGINYTQYEGRDSLIAQQYVPFERDVRDYLRGESGGVVPTLATLVKDWKVDNLGMVQIKIRKIMPNPGYSTILYAVRTAPQLGTNSNGTPVYGTGPMGEMYTVHYPKLIDSATKI